jgi:hypothetical protein
MKGVENNGGMKQAMTEVTFKDFARLANELGWTVEMLAERFYDTLDRPAEFFERVLSCRWKNSDGRYEDRSSVVIPYRSVLRLYFTELRSWQAATGLDVPLTENQKARNQKGGKASANKRLEAESMVGQPSGSQATIIAVRSFESIAISKQDGGISKPVTEVYGG